MAIIIAIDFFLKNTAKYSIIFIFINIIEYMKWAFFTRFCPEKKKLTNKFMVGLHEKLIFFPQKIQDEFRWRICFLFLKEFLKDEDVLETKDFWGLAKINKKITMFFKWNQSLFIYLFNFKVSDRLPERNVAQWANQF